MLLDQLEAAASWHKPGKTRQRRRCLYAQTGAWFKLENEQTWGVSGSSVPIPAKPRARLCKRMNVPLFLPRFPRWSPESSKRRRELQGR